MTHAVSRSAVLVVVAAATGLATASCGSDRNENNAPSYSSGLPRDQQLSALTDNDVQKLCQTATAYSGSQTSQDMPCRLAGIGSVQAAAAAQLVNSDSNAQQVCRDAYDICARQMQIGDAGASSSEAGQEAAIQTTAAPEPASEGGMTEGGMTEGGMTEGGMTDAGQPTACAKPPATCSANVGEFETCVTDQANAFRSIPTCDRVTVAMFRQDAGTLLPTTPTSCLALEQKCPGVTR